MALYPYSFQAAFDPNTGTAAPRDSVGQVYPVGDTSFTTPLPTFDLNGLPVTLTVGEHGYLPDFQVEDHTAVVWRSGEYVFQFATTVPVKGDRGDVGKSAYESAVENGFEGTEDEWLESLKGANVLPTDEAIAAALTSEGPAQTAAKKLTDSAVQAEVVPVALAVQELGQTADQAARALNRAYTVTRVAAAGTIPEHYIIRLKHGAAAGRTVHRIVGGDSISVSPPHETLGSYYAKTKAPVLVNATGWWSGDNNRVMGLSILNGQLIQGWDPQPNDLGQEAAVFMRDGSLRMYDNTTAPEQVIADGGWNSFGWGSAVYKDGAITNFLSLNRYALPAARQLVGDTLDGDLLLITFPNAGGSGGATGQMILDAVANLRIKSLYVLDGGGSAQTMVDGKYVVPSSDGAPRDVPDALYFYAPRVGPRTDTNWLPITQRNAGWSGGGVEYRVRGEDVYVRVVGVNWAGPGAATLSPVCSLPPEVPRPPWHWTGLAYLNSKPGEGQNCRVGVTGSIDFTASAPGAVSHIFQYPL